eukprot:3527373-Rhodomonas_salina.1
MSLVNTSNMRSWMPTPPTMTVDIDSVVDRSSSRSSSEPSSPVPGVFPLNRQSSHDTVILRPRASPGTGSHRAREEITITRALLESWFCLPLNEAAKKSGVSVTAFKRVCRSLGVRAWPYRFREALPSASSQHQEPSHQESSPEPFFNPSQTKFEMPSETDAGAWKENEESVSMEQQELMELLARSKRVWGSSPSKCEEKSVVENYDFGWLVRPLDNHSPSSSS